MSKMEYLKGMPIAVLGGGAAGKTCAADCKLGGSEVRLYDAMPFAETSLRDVDKTGILLDGVQRNKYCFERSGRAYFDLVTTDIGAAVKGAGQIIVAMGSWGHESTFRALIPHLEDGQVVHVFADNFGCLPCLTEPESRASETSSSPMSVQNTGPSRSGALRCP